MVARDLSAMKGTVSGTSASACRDVCCADALGGAGAVGGAGTLGDVATADAAGDALGRLGGGALCRSPIK
jgi:hypothetical protein